MALRNRPKVMTNVFDIGCADGFLLKKLSHLTKRQDGVDPRLFADSVGPNSELKKGFFPSAVEEHQMKGNYDAIFALAVFEHFSEEDIQRSATVIAKMLSPAGRLILTVPHPFVDTILDVLHFLRLIDGQALEEHHSFSPETLINYFSNVTKIGEARKIPIWPE